MGRECEHGYFMGKGCDACAEYERSHRAETSLNLEVISLRAELNAILAVLEPLGARYLDPPDGGDVSTAEQIRRIVSTVTELEAAIALIGKFNKEGANDLRIASQVTFALMPD